MAKKGGGGGFACVSSLQTHSLIHGCIDSEVAGQDSLMGPCPPLESTCSCCITDVDQSLVGTGLVHNETFESASRLL